MSLKSELGKRCNERHDWSLFYSLEAAEEREKEAEEEEESDGEGIPISGDLCFLSLCRMVFRSSTSRC